MGMSDLRQIVDRADSHIFLFHTLLTPLGGLGFDMPEGQHGVEASEGERV